MTYDEAKRLHVCLCAANAATPPDQRCPVHTPTGRTITLPNGSAFTERYARIPDRFRPGMMEEAPNPLLSVVDYADLELRVLAGCEVPADRIYGSAGNSASESRRAYAAEKAANPSPEALEEGKRLKDAGYRQLSRKHRIVARLPPGKTGLEALREADSEAYERVMRLAEESAAEDYRRFHARGEDRRELSIEEFAAFRKAGGRRWLFFRFRERRSFYRTVPLRAFISCRRSGTTEGRKSGA